MRVRHFSTAMLAGAGALALTACGGGAEMATNVIQSPPLTPTPTPSPTPTPTPGSTLSIVDIFTPPPAGTLTAIGLEAPGDNRANLTGAGFSVSYDALFDRYLIAVPSMPSGYFYRRSAGDVDASWLIGTLATLDRTGAHGAVEVLKPSGAQLQLTYTTLAGYNGYSDTGVPFGWFAFGTATPVSGVPVTGTATYNALIRGASIERYAQVTGTAALTFDFGVGKLSGHLDPVLYDPTGLGFNDTQLGRYDFVNTVYSAGSTGFSGQLSNANVAGLGSFTGLFTGPSAEELMARWSAPYQFPGINQTQQMFGVVVGKRQ